ncbi:MAG: hypothetical protein ACR2O1_17170 [Boseongicola sp.]
MQRLAAAATLLIAALLTGAEQAEAQEACAFYRVKQGDTLRAITMAAYGHEQFRMIYGENRTEIGRNPNLITIGLVLRLPCLDGSMPQGAAPAVIPNDDTISFVTANGYLPYTDESLNHRGLFTHLVTNAMFRASPETPLEIVFVNDWSAHLETLLPRQAFDASFPWTRPGCETQGTLTSIELYACQNFAYSDPFYEIVDGFFALPGSGFESVADFRDLQGASICRPEGYPTGHLEENGLMPPEVTLLQPASTYSCFDLLVSGKADVVALDTRTGDRVLSDMGLTFQVAENLRLFSIQPLRVALHNSNPNTADLIKDLNAGLKIMHETGEWASIVSEGLKEHALVN